MRPRRSMLFIPGANAAMLSTSFVYGADAVMFDLEDAVALREKDTARLLVHHALQHPFYQDVEKVVRINPLNTPFGLADLKPSCVVARISCVYRKPTAKTMCWSWKRRSNGSSVNVDVKLAVPG